MDDRINIAPPTAFYHHPDWTREKLGDVFGLTLDNTGNVYVAASSVYGGYVPSASTAHVGNIGAGTGGVYKIANGSGTPTVFAGTQNLATWSSGNLLPNTGPGLGNIHYDCARNQFYVSNFEDGMIYRVSPAGQVPDRWDHGGSLASATVNFPNPNLTPLDNPALTAAEKTPINDSQTAGFTQRGRRVWAVQTYNGRLYYSIWKVDFRPGGNTSGLYNEVWSVGIDGATGAFIGPANRELRAPWLSGQQVSSPISDISFGPTGKMLLAERTMEGDAKPQPEGNIFWAHRSRALEYSLSAGAWNASGTFFEIGNSGSIPRSANSSGGVDYDYRPTGRVWATGDALHLGNFSGLNVYSDYIYGLQGSPSSGTGQTPSSGITTFGNGGTRNSILIDLDGNTAFNDRLAKNQIGDVEVPCLLEPCPTISLSSTPNPLPMGTAGVNYPDTQFMASGGTGPYMYSATGLPPGLSLSMDGQLTGKPTQMGTFAFTIFVKDANGCTAEIRREIVVRCRQYTIKPDALPAGFAGTVYPKQTFMTDSPCPPATYSVSGNLPPGLILTNGMLQGTPTQAGSYQFTVNVTDACGCPSRKIYTVVIKDCPRVPIKGLFNTGVDNNKTPLNNGVPDGHYTVTMQNGTTSAPVVIPPGGGWVTIPNARWIGRPGAGGTNRYTIQFDLSGCDPSSVSIVGRYAASLNGYILVNNSTTQLFPTPANGATMPTNFTISSGFQPGPNTLTFVAAPGPALGGVLVEFTEATARCCECPPIAIGPAALSVGKRNTPYGPLSLTATGGMAPYTFTIIGGGLPNGMMLSPDGVLSGTPTVAGTFTFKVLVVDGMNCTGMREYVLLIRRRLIFFDYDVRNSAANLAAEEQQSNTLTLRINVDALGDEKSIGLSLGFNQAVLGNPRVTLGADAAGAALNVNASQVAQGSIGMSVTMPAGRTLADGQRHVFNVLFDYAAANTGARTNFEFKDTPVARSVTGADGNSLPAETAAKPVVLARPVTSVSAANYRGETLAAEEIVAAFGVSLATTTQLATTLPLPTQLAGTTVKVRDSAGTERLAPLFFVSPTQVNYLVPAGTAVGTATVIIISGDGAVSGGAVDVAGVAPGLFVADASGRGLAAANALTLKPDNTFASQPVARFDLMTSRFVAVPIDLGTANERVFLSAFGTGLRNRSSLETVRAIIGGIEAPVLFAGAQGSLTGLDQLNIEIPRSLAGSGLVDVVLMVEGKTANTAQIQIR